MRYFNVIKLRKNLADKLNNPQGNLDNSGSHPHFSSYMPQGHNPYAANNFVNYPHLACGRKSPYDLQSTGRQLEARRRPELTEAYSHARWHEEHS
jgi:hypothetical protein